MNTCCPSNKTALPPAASRFLPDDMAQPYIYSFRCSRGMEESLSRLMHELGLNRTSVIRLALYALDCISRRQEVQQLPLSELVEQLGAMAPERHLSFCDFIRGKWGA